MKIAIPTAEGQLCAHFGHCQQFVLFSVDTEKKVIIGKEAVPPPPHQPGVLPQWLNQLGCNVIIAGGMGHRAISLFDQFGISVITGVESGVPEDIVNAYLNDSLISGQNVCDNSAHHHDGSSCRSHGEGVQ